MIGPSITERDLFVLLRAFLTDILPTSTEVIRGWVNRVAAPTGDFVLMTSLRRERLETNIDVAVDTVLTGQIVDDTLTVFDIQNGSLAVGSLLFGAPATPLLTGTRVTAFVGGGAYTVTPVQTYPVGMIYSGVTRTVMPTEVTIQLDVFGNASAGNAQTIATLLRDEYATRFFAQGSPDPLIQPLYASEPRAMAFITAESQFEERWLVEAMLQANIEVDTPMQFADQVNITIRPAVDLILIP